MGLKIIVKDSNEAFGLKMQVDLQGIRPGEGYTWRYTPKVLDWFGTEEIMPATAEFEFDDPAWETYFQLKWAR